MMRKRSVFHALRTIVAVSLLLGALPLMAHAQFNGPSPTSAGDINKPVALTTDQAILFPPKHDLHLFPGDLIAVHVYPTSDYSPVVRVSLDGSIQLPLIGSIPVQGLTIPEAEKLISDKLIAAGMYRNPQITLQLTESPNQVATVVGELHAAVPIVGQNRLLDVLTAAGGLPAVASRVITIHRLGVEQPIVVDLGSDPMTSQKSDIPIFAGDTIVVARAGVVYLLGAFKNVGAIPIQQSSPLTLIKAASLAGGQGFEGKMDDLRLIRTVGNNRTVMRLDIKRVINGKDPDPVLQADDIVFLPSSGMKSAIKSGGIGTVLAFISLLVLATR